MHSSGDTNGGLSCSESELALFLIYTLLVTLTVACLVSVCELALFLMCTLLVTLTVVCLVLASELALFLMCTLLVTLTVAFLVQYVSWPGFNVHSSDETDCGLSCFRM